MVNCYDYLVSTIDGSVVRGDMNKLNHYIYSLGFIISDKEKIITNCPNCSAKLEGDSSSVTCEYCGSSINRKPARMVLERKEMIHQE